MVAVPSIGRADRAPARSAPEADAARDLYERYARQIYTYCLHQLRNKEEAEDATQSTFLNAFRGLQRGVDPEFESAWLYKIAQNVCLTRQRSSSRRRKVESPGDLDSMQDFVPAHEVDSDELIRLPEALEGMPEQQRRALLLREWQGLSYREIADELGLSQAAVETLLFRARRTLAAGLTEEQKPTTVGRRIRAGGDVGSILAVVKSVAFTAGSKIAATVATVLATSVVAASPSARHVVEHAVVPTYPTAKPAAHHVLKQHAARSPRKTHAVAHVQPAVAPAQVTTRHVTQARPAPHERAAAMRRSAASSVVAAHVSRTPEPDAAPAVTQPAAAAEPAPVAPTPPAVETPPAPQPEAPAAEQPAPPAPAPSVTTHGHDGNGKAKGSRHSDDVTRMPQSVIATDAQATPADPAVARTPEATDVQPVATTDPAAAPQADDAHHGRDRDQGDHGSGKRK